MTLDELLLEWSYRSERGYPSLDSPSDISLLNILLKELNLPSETILNRMSEGPLNPGELRKERNPNRAEVFLKKIENDEEFELMDGSMVVIDKEQSADSIQKLKDKNFNKLIFVNTLGKQLKLNQFKKTSEFGAGSGAGGGSVDTRIMESAHCYGCAIAYYIIKGKITDNDLIRENFEKAKSYVNVDATIDEIEEFLERKSLWYNSTAKSVNRIFELFPNKGYTFHRGSEQVNKIYNAWKVGKKQRELKLMDDKWNPSDIWLMTSKVENFNWSNDLSVLNGEIAQFYGDGDLIGISLKMIGKKTDAKSQVYNDPGIPPGNVYQYEGYKSTSKSSTLDILYNGGSITCRNFSVETGWSTEIKGKAAQGGKCGHTGVNDILKINNLPLLPKQKDVLVAFQTDNEEYYNKFYYLFDRFVENISKDNFKILYNEKPLSWKTSNYMNLEFLLKLEDNQSKADEILNDVMRYASSSTKISSQFIKIS
tara:strand:- start:620 stop:2062 length:1443 start_codon:yes stop_codon:yes gene_type:complete